MSRILILSTYLLVLLSSAVTAQVIDLDEEQKSIVPEKFEKSTMYYLTPAGALAYQIGDSNMAEKLSNSLDLKPNRLYDLSTFGFGWRRKDMFYNFHVALPIFPNSISKTTGNVKSVAELSTTYGEFTVGRAVISNESYFIILKGGLGFIGSQLQIRQYTTNSFDLDNFRVTQGTAWPRLEHLSGTFDIALEYTPRALRPLSVIPSIQLGYKGGMGSPDWTSPDASLTNNVTDRISLIYLRSSVVISRQR